MPISTTIDRGRDLAVFTATGELTFDEQMGILRDFYGGEPTSNVIWDFRAIAGNRISSEELRRIIDFIKSRAPKRGAGKTALVAETQLDFGLGRMSRSLAESENLPWEIRAFRSMAEAEVWIG